MQAYGSIPACAGEPLEDALRVDMSRVYPRVCGGTRALSAKPPTPGGLSPRVRGNPGDRSARAHRVWSIPACAGEPIIGLALVGRLKVYPRVCGGTTLSEAALRLLAGLSPRVRGNQIDAYLQAVGRGSIPACAGEPSRLFRRERARAVYPRVCGGTRGYGDRDASRDGLSPRVRGNHDRPPFALLHIRSIPACAGEPLPLGRYGSSQEVYPRVCGGTEQIHAAHDEEDGLSPRVRGNLARELCDPVYARSIPACAGEPASLPAWWRRSSVYPRVCGGTRYVDVQHWLRAGLSPRVRGNHQPGRTAPAAHGSIPACAGEPSTRMSLTLCAGVYPRVCGGTPRGDPP